MSVESINAAPVAISNKPAAAAQNVKQNDDLKQTVASKVEELAKVAEPSSEELVTAVDKLNNFVTNVAQRDLSFTVDKESNQTVVVVKDKLTQEVIRQMPTKEALAVAKQIESMLGLILNDKA